VKKYVGLLFALVLTEALFAQSPPDTGAPLETGRNATLRVEATTAFGWDIENEQTGLDSKVGIEMIFPLFPKADRGVFPKDYDTIPSVRLLLKDVSFTWWNSYETKGGNYNQDDFVEGNSPRPLTLTFDTFLADVVWQNYFFRVAGTPTIMRTDAVSLRSIFDDVMDVGDRWYYRRNFALWRSERYNIQDLPLLRRRLTRDLVDDDYRETVSGSLALGAEFERFNAAVKAASNKWAEQNTDNAWLFGLDFEVVPIDKLRMTGTGFMGSNYDKTSIGKNPLNFGLLTEYQLPLSEELILTPFFGFDYAYDTVWEDSAWELGGGLMFYSRGFEKRVSYRILDWDDVIPIGASIGMNINNDSHMNIVLSWFDPAGPDSLLPNFGGFLQIELADILDKKEESMDFAILGQFEYNIGGKFTPYVRSGFKPEVLNNGDKTDDNFIPVAFGCFMTPINFLAIDVRYELNNRQSKAGDMEVEKSLFSAVFTIRL
jgi:hypothetical protein